MGMIWKAMPLLSTLAALVIIVHSAEEDMDRGLSREYRNDYRERLLDTGPPNYDDDEPWRAVHTEPMMQKSTHGDIWEDSPERPLKQRKPARKRKRRPLATPEERKQDRIHSKDNHRIESFKDGIHAEENHRDDAFNDRIHAEESHRGEATHDEDNYKSASFKINTPEVIQLLPAASEMELTHETDEPIRYRDTRYKQETTEIPRRRRKRPENRRNRWAEDYVDVERPTQRRGLRRKRPSLDNALPRFSEFEDFRINFNDDTPQDKAPHDNPPIKTYDNEENHYGNDNVDNSDPEERNKNDDDDDDKSTSVFSMEMVDSQESNRPLHEHNKLKAMEKASFLTATNLLDKIRCKYPYKLPASFFKISNQAAKAFLQKQYNSKAIEKLNVIPLSSKILSQSITNMKTSDDGLVIPFFGIHQTLHELIADLENELKLGERPIDPKTLKDILKRSNGTSLSEILQQHNLSLSDLLRGKEDTMAIVKPEEISDKDSKNPTKDKPEVSNLNTNQKENVEVAQEPKLLTPVTETNIDDNQSIHVPEENAKTNTDLESQSAGTEIRQQKGETIQKTSETKENEPKISPMRRIPGQRRKLRMRPSMNGTHKSQLNRDLMAQTARKYHNSRNITKSKEWKYVVPLMNVSNSSEEIRDVQLTTTSEPEETTVIFNTEYYNPSTVTVTTQTEAINGDIEDDAVEKETTTFIINTTQEISTLEATTTTAKPRVSRLRPAANRMGLRRQAYNNRLKRKRMKQRNSTTKSPVEEDQFEVDLFGMPNLVSSAEFIARTQTPKSTHTDDHNDDFTTLEDFITTEKSKHAVSGPRFTRNSSITTDGTTPENKLVTSRYVSTTEETAKFEIEEILNDTRTSARLSKILMERNMTLNELVEHRERGSSHVHLADIFHNASKEPNPPEPFLTKSSIEPISRETYPLRAILEANLHESAAKGTTIDPTAETYAAVNIPVVMDFGNNVNENAENMGIMSLFNKFNHTDISSTVEKSTIGKDSQGTPYVTTVILVNNTDSNETISRESRVLKEDENNLKNDVVAWSQLFELMRKNQHQQNKKDDLLTINNDDDLKHHVLLQDSDGDGLIVLEDLQRLKDFDVETAVENKLDINSYEADTGAPGILNRSPSHSRSVTVATASIVGLAMILFLLTYAAFKWKQQRNLLRKKQNFPDERIPTPVFENRKGHKHHASTRSISPMLATSNIYTLNTLDSNGKESPDYMWDSLRKPFQ